MTEKELLKNETLAEKLIKKGSWLYIFSFLIAPSGYIIKLLISNDLSVSEVGVIYSIISLVGILANYNDLGFTESLQYFLPKFWINKKYDKFKTSIFLALLVQTFTAIFIAFGLWFGADWLGNYYFHSLFAVEVLKVFSLWFIIYNIFRTLDTIFQSFQDTFSYKLVEFIRMWGVVVFTAIIFFSHNGNILNYSIAWFVGTFMGLLFAITIFCKKYKSTLIKGKININNKITKQLFSYSIWVIIGSQASILLGQIDQQMIIYFLGPEQAGYYTNYLSLLTMYILILGPLFGFLFPITTELSAKKETWKLSMMLSMFLKYFGAFGIYRGVLMFVFGPNIAYILFGEKFIISGELLQFGGTFIFLNIIFSIIFPILAGLGKIKERVKILWFTAIINIILNIILIKYIGAYGAIISTVFGWFIMVASSLYLINKENIKINIDFKFVIKNIILAVILGAILFLINSYIGFISRGQNFMYLMILCLIYAGIILLGNLYEVKLFLNELKRMKGK